MTVIVVFSENDTGKVLANNIQYQEENRSKGSFRPNFYHPSQLFLQTLASTTFFTVEYLCL